MNANKFRVKYQVNIYTIVNIYYFNSKFHSELQIEENFSNRANRKCAFSFERLKD